MDRYYGVIWFKDGRKIETGTVSGSCAEQSCERMTARQFDYYMRTATTERAKPTRYEVKVKNDIRP